MTDNVPLLEWQRGPRESFCPGAEKGVYALFLRDGAVLNGIAPGECGLLYIGRATRKEGLIGRCHFGNARTRDHSPRKSLAVLLMDALSLMPILVPKPNSPDTWGLEQDSDKALTEWMYAHLDVAYEVRTDPTSREAELIRDFAPPLNLKGCTPTEKHRWISSERTKVLKSLKYGG